MIGNLAALRPISHIATRILLIGLFSRGPVQAFHMADDTDGSTHPTGPLGPTG